MKPSPRLVARGLLALACWSSVAGAQSLSPVWTFDTDTAGWSVVPGQAAIDWSPEDARGNVQSGSLRLRNPWIGQENSALSECFPVPVPRIVAGADLRIPAQSATGVLLFGMWRYPDLASCQADADGTGSFIEVTWPAWGLLLLPDSDGGPYARLAVTAGKTSGLGFFSVQADNVHVCERDGKGDFGGLPGGSTVGTDLLLRRDSTGQVYVWHMAGATRRYEELLDPQPAARAQIQGADDFDGDGQSDLVVRSRSLFGDFLSFWFMRGSHRVGSAPLTGAPALDADWQLAATGDFNHDRKPDLLWRNVRSNKLRIWTLDGTTYTGTLIPSPDQAVDGNWLVRAALDYNGDGQRDLLWYNTTSGNVVFWFMDENVVRIAGQLAVPASPGDANWQAVAGGDYGFDATSPPCANDIVWRNSTSGKLVVWYMDHTGTRRGGAFLTPDAPAPDPADWSVLGPR